MADDITMTPRDRLRAAMDDARRRALKPPPMLTVDQWADEYRVLSTKGGSTGGKWQTSKVEIARGPMRAVHEPGVRTITGMACAQLWKTEFLLNVVGYFIHLDPCPLMLVQPTVEMAESVSKDRIAPMLRDAPVLAELTTPRSRDSDNTILHKSFPGGQLTLVGAMSPSQLASRPIRVVLFDEVGRYVASAGTEGDPIGLAEERMETFASNSLSIRVSSPGIKGACRIERSYLESDQRRPFVSCPHCDTRQVLRWGDERTAWGVKWAKDADGADTPDGAAYHCSFCGLSWTEAQRMAAIQGVDWRQCRPYRCCGIDHDPEADHVSDQSDSVWVWDGWVHRAKCRTCGKMSVDNSHAGYWANRIYSPFRPLSHLVRKFLSDRTSPESLKKFVNTALAETWVEQGEAMDASSLAAKREIYPCGDQVPAGAVALFSAVDAQRNRLEVQTIVVGRDDEIWVVDYVVLPGDPGDPETLLELDTELKRVRTRPDGTQMSVQAACVDVGDGAGGAAALYRFCAERKGRRVWAIRGAKDRNAAIWARKASVSKSFNSTFYPVGTQLAKDLLWRRLQLPMPDISRPPPGYIHLSDTVCDQAYLDQLTSEQQHRRETRGTVWYEWRNATGARNEAWDTLVYAYAAYCGWISMGGVINRRAAQQARGLTLAEDSPTETADSQTAAAGPTSEPESPTKPTESPTLTVVAAVPEPTARGVPPSPASLASRVRTHKRLTRLDRV